MTAERTFAALIAFALGFAGAALALGRPEWVAYAALAASVAFICWGLAVALAEPAGEVEPPASPPPPTFAPTAWVYGHPDLPPGMTYEEYAQLHRPPDSFVRLHHDTESGDYDIRALWPTDTGAPE